MPIFDQNDNISNLKSAIKQEKRQLIKTILKEYGSSISHCSFTEVIILTIKIQKLELLNLMLDHHVNVYNTALGEESALVHAASLKLWDIVAEIIDKSLKYSDTYSAKQILGRVLLLAILAKHDPTIRKLLPLPIDFTIKDNNDKYALEYLIQQGNKEMITIFLTYHRKNYLNTHLVSVACIKKQWDLVLLLLPIEEIPIKDSNLDFSLGIATRERQTEVVRALLKPGLILIHRPGKIGLL